MESFRVGVTLLVLIPVVSTFMFGERCTILPQGFIPDGEHRDYVVPGSCTNGTIDWNYPKEYVIIHFQGEGHAQYSVCLGGNLGGDMFTLYDVTGDTKQAIPKGTWPCVQAQNGHVSIEIHAPEFQTYMGAVDYSVQTS